jgi:hypothetical protein
MRTLLALMMTALPLTAEEIEIRNLYLPPWYEKADLQIYTLEIKVSEPQVWIKHACTVFTTNDVVQGSNGVVRTSLIIDLKKTQFPFSILIMVPDDEGKPTITKSELRCHLSLVPLQYQVHTWGHRFTVTNLTEHPLIVESRTNLTIHEQTDRHITGVLHGEARLKLKDMPAILLHPVTHQH